MNTVVIHRDGSAKLLGNKIENNSAIDGEIFVTNNPHPEWLGFYDWLRMRSGDVIGVRLQLDAPSAIASDILDFLCALDARNSNDELYIFFDTNREFEPAMSDDADFGGNVLYLGDRGSVALTFNAPTVRIE